MRPMDEGKGRELVAAGNGTGGCGRPGRKVASNGPPGRAGGRVRGRGVLSREDPKRCRLSFAVYGDSDTVRLSSYERRDLTGPRKKLLDVVFKIWPSTAFVREVKA